MWSHRRDYQALFFYSTNVLDNVGIAILDHNLSDLGEDAV